MKLEKTKEYKYAKYRWEFFRRNPEAVKALSASLIEKGLSLAEVLTLPAEMLNFLDHKVAKLIKKANWTTGLSLDQILEEIRKIDSGKAGDVLVYALLSNPALKCDYSKTKLKIKIDLKAVYSLSALKKQVSKKIEEYYSLAVQRKHITPKKRPNMTDFDVILKVGDMKRDGKKDNEIAKALNPRKYKIDPDGVMRIVRYMHKRYKQMVEEGGFVHITYL
jgi:hypothetical protein